MVVLLQSVAALHPFHATLGVYDPLFSAKEGVTDTTHFHFQQLFCCPSGEAVSARTRYLCFRIVFRMDFCFQGYSLTLYRIYAGLSSGLCSVLKFHCSINKCVKGVVSSHTHVATRPDARTSLTNNDGPCCYQMPVITLYSQSLAVAVSTVATGAPTFFMRHPLSPF